MRYDYDTEPAPLIARWGRANRRFNAKFPPSDALEPSTRSPGSIEVQLRLRGYPDWKRAPKALRGSLLQGIERPEDLATLAQLLSSYLYPAYREIMFVLPVDGRGRVMGWYAAGVGALGSVAVTPQDIFRSVIPLPSSRLLLAHNHPSGDPTPSREDVLITEQLAEGGRLLGIQVLDHLVIGRDGAFSSLAELGLLR